PWMDENPGVKLEQITFDVYDQEALLVAISGGTAPSFYPAEVLASWNEEQVLAAEKSGLAADVTDQVAQNDLEAKLADYCVPIWNTKAIDGRHYALPYSYNCGDGIHYRIDLIQEAGLEEPAVDWSWEDLRALAMALTNDERKGIGMHTWGLALPLAAEAWGYTVLRNRLPDPASSWNWKWDFTASGEEWANIIAWFRAMIFEDQSVLADVAMEDDQIVSQFLQGTTAMMNNNSTYHTTSPSPSVELSMSRAADELGKPVDEVFGYVPHPMGNNGWTATSWGQLDTMALNPDLDTTALDKAASLHVYMMGPGFVSQKIAAFEQTDDLRYVWVAGDITPLYKMSELEGIPGTPEEAWGEGFMENVLSVANRPLMPWPHWFIPLQTQTGPSETPMDDARDRWFLEAGEPDIMADLQGLQDTMNQQAASFTSEIPDDEFVAGAKAFYDAQAAYWEETSPDFYNNVFKPWYDSLVAPALG
ncbi:MAG: ABC transporter substrate-binding protein, partial [Thermomicrobiales bacterium]